MSAPDTAADTGQVSESGRVPGSVEEWENRYSGAEAVWSGRPNVALVDVVTDLDLTPGRSLDVGSGEGADVIWLAGGGWQAAGIALSPTAIARSRAAAESAGADADFAAADLVDWATADDHRGAYDLVTGCFLHTRLPDTRADLMRHLGELVSPGGTLILISHATVPPWAGGEASEHEGAGHEHHGLDGDFGTPEEDFALLTDSGGGPWELVLAETRNRPVTGPDGTESELEDGILVARKV
ncbi:MULTISPECIES: methyltransferase domain-containing protein [unclassified Brevibacterium]|uniref:class I SAM-dependent methyltransferase n=1 Tax=unclassified Brevibacterium TaxID=2614124 RepID=UPI0020183980|nr:methyltransferase domain-containing protein [Brevibacterium sp. 2SA]MCM1013325.1 class I SAM-dependent methyltransferase [Brevibacterium sp. XM4083]